MDSLKQNLKHITGLFIIGIFILLMAYVLLAKEAGAHRGRWRVSPGFAEIEQLVEYMNKEGFHDEFEIVTDLRGGYRIIFED